MGDIPTMPIVSIFLSNKPVHILESSACRQRFIVHIPMLCKAPKRQCNHIPIQCITPKRQFKDIPMLCKVPATTYSIIQTPLPSIQSVHCIHTYDYIPTGSKPYCNLAAQPIYAAVAKPTRIRGGQFTPTGSRQREQPREGSASHPGGSAYPNCERERVAIRRRGGRRARPACASQQRPARPAPASAHAATCSRR